MNTNALSHTSYTAAKLSAALCLSKRSILKSLEEIEPTEIAIIRGNEAPAWSIEVLPDILKGKLLRAARQANQSVEVLIGTAAQPWVPRIALGQMSQDEIARA